MRENANGGLTAEKTFRILEKECCSFMDHEEKYNTARWDAGQVRREGGERVKEFQHLGTSDRVVGRPRTECVARIFYCEHSHLQLVNAILTNICSLTIRSIRQVTAPWLRYPKKRGRLQREVCPEKRMAKQERGWTRKVSASLMAITSHLPKGWVSERYSCSDSSACLRLRMRCATPMHSTAPPAIQVKVTPLRPVSGRPTCLVSPTVMLK